MSGGGRLRRRAAGLACCAVLPLMLGACDSGAGSGNAASGGLGQIVLATGPAGYRVALDGALSADQMAGATSSDPHALAQTLARTGYDGGWSRIWASGDSYLAIVAAQTGSPFGAQELLEFQAAQLTAGRGVTPYDDPDVPGARAFDFYGTTRQGGRQVFCEGVIFQVAADVFTLNDCAPGPRPADRVLAAARSQYLRAAPALGVPVATPS